MHLVGKNQFHLRSGRTFYASYGLLSVASAGTQLYDGFDSECYLSDDDSERGISDFTRDERREIALYMIRRWRRWARDEGDKNA
jgi:hypothetical protein